MSARTRRYFLDIAVSLLIGTVLISDQSVFAAASCEMRTACVVLSWIHLEVFRSNKSQATQIVTASASRMIAKDLRNVWLPVRRAIARKIDSIGFLASWLPGRLSDIVGKIRLEDILAEKTCRHHN